MACEWREMFDPPRHARRRDIHGIAMIRMALLSSKRMTSQSCRYFHFSQLKSTLGPLDRSTVSINLCHLTYLTPLKHGGLYSGRPVYASLSTTSAAANPSLSEIQSKWQQRFKLIARVAYYFRIPFLVLSVYGIGYQQGIMDFSREPEKIKSGLLDTILTSVGCTSTEDKKGVLIADEGQSMKLLSKLRYDLRHAQDGASHDLLHQRMVMMQNSSMVGEKIVKGARAYVKDKLAEAVKETTSRMSPKILQDEDLLYQLLGLDEDVKLWTNAQKHMEGPWQFILIPSMMPNAFVSEILPHRIFITTALFETFIASQDELALVLGHEISHLILGHHSSRNALETASRTLEILFLSLDPTEGLLSLGIMSGLASIRSAVGALHSREHERAADELGVKLTAIACYDTGSASRVFYKMHKYNEENGRELGFGGLFNSHPPSEERYLALLKESEEENPRKYVKTSCASLTTMFFDMLKQNGI